MFKRSNSGQLFFLQRETTSKENAIVFHEYGNCYNSKAVKCRVSHNQSLYSPTHLNVRLNKLSFQVLDVEFRCKSYKSSKWSFSSSLSNHEFFLLNCVTSSKPIMVFMYFEYLVQSHCTTWLFGGIFNSRCHFKRIGHIRPTLKVNNPYAKTKTEIRIPISEWYVWLQEWMPKSHVFKK